MSRANVSSGTPQQIALDDLQRYIAGAAAILGLKIESTWLSGVQVHLETALKHADSVSSFVLPDEAETAPTFRN